MQCRTNMAVVKYFAVFMVCTNVVLLLVLIVITIHTWSGNTVDRKDTADGIAVSVNQSLQAAVREDVSEDTEKVQRELSKFYGKSTKPAGHLTIISPYNATENPVTLNWQHAPELTFLERGLMYKDGGLVVSNGGYYYVYSQIRYQGDGTEELSYGRIIHNVLMQKSTIPKETPTVLMQNLQSTPVIRRGRLAYTTSSLGATFYLEANTTVLVNSSIPQNIDTSPYGTYFGAFLI